MKKLILLLAIGVLGVSSLMAQSPVDKIFEDHYGEKGFTNVTITQYLFEMIAKMDTTESGREMTEMAKSIESIRVLAMDTIVGDVNLYDETMAAISKSDYKELMRVKEENNDIVFMVNEKNGKVSELLMVVGGPKEENVLISIKGDIDLAKMGSMAKTMNIKGMENLEKLGE
ncbi:MAG: hypothetical protein B7C24_05630 [Bacteroidetes bacterium 4572_77]|nr:MAG: hypothetical protein B7C24_05630 [Bacteroidetes bacterium 4572_77]